MAFYTITSFYPRWQPACPGFLPVNPWEKQVGNNHEPKHEL